jgi:hypothetical protein
MHTMLPAAPIADPSVAVQIPEKIDPRTAKIKIKEGIMLLVDFTLSFQVIFVSLTRIGPTSGFILQSTRM